MQLVNAPCVSIHGANRLGGNSLAELIIFGKFAGKDAAEKAKERFFSSENNIKKKAENWENLYNTRRNLL